MHWRQSFYQDRDDNETYEEIEKNYFIVTRMDVLHRLKNVRHFLENASVVYLSWLFSNHLFVDCGIQERMVVTQ